jgi:hypothetical protein
MTERDDISSADDALLASADGAPETSVEGASPAPTEASDNRSRIEQLMREKQAAEAFAQARLAEAGALRDRVQAPARASDYASPEDFTRAVAANAVREAGADLLARQAEEARQRAAQAAEAAWVESTAAFRARVPDFEQVAHNPNLPVTPIMADAIRESPRGAELAYFLGKNPEEAARIAALSPVSQATAIARLESKLGDASASVSRAPAPFSALSGRSGGAGKRLEDMDFEEYRRARGF